MRPVNPQVLPEETLARFAVDQSYFRASDNSVRHNAFMPDKNTRVSVYRQQGLTEAEIWQLGMTHVAQPRNKQLLGRAVITARDIFRKGFDVIPEEPPPLHANICGFHQEPHKWKEQALELAALARFIRV